MSSVTHLMDIDDKRAHSDILLGNTEMSHHQGLIFKKGNSKILRNVTICISYYHCLHLNTYEKQASSITQVVSCGI